MLRARATALLAACAAVAGCALTDDSAAERARLRASLGRDPVVLLAQIGRAEGPHMEQVELWTAARQLELLRFGFAHRDERVVLGAARFLGRHDCLPLPELGRAVPSAAPHLVDADSPLDWDTLAPAIGSGDFAALADVLPRMPERAADQFLGALHRMVRPDAVPVLCELARTSHGAVRRHAFVDACLCAEYSDQHRELLVATFLDCVGRAPDPDPAPGDDGLPGSLRAALRAELELPVGEAPRQGVPDRRRPSLPSVAARWLAACRAGPDDARLLREIMLLWSRPAGEAAAWSLAAMSDRAAARAVLDGPPPGAVSDVCWTAARARLGDDEALEQLLAGRDDALAFGLALASPERRRRFCEDLLAMPAEPRAELVGDLGDWAAGRLWGEAYVTPSYEPRYLEALEPLVATRALDGATLRLLVESLPGCATARVADVLLQRPADELFGPFVGTDERAAGLGDAWSFLEVTRPDAFRRRLREGFTTSQGDVRMTCGALLLRLGDAELPAGLLAWLDDGEADWPGWEFPWFERATGYALLARSRDPRLVAELRRRAARDDVEPTQLRALAVALGMPFEVAVDWEPGLEKVSAVREALLAGDPVRAMLVTEPEPPSNAIPWFAWGEPAVTAWLARRRESPDVTVEGALQLDLARVAVEGDADERARAIQPVLDGRYATHNGYPPAVAARLTGIEVLPFWVDQLGSNCCKCVFVDEVFAELLGRDTGAFDRSRLREPASAFLRRTLLPERQRLRWSRVARAYVLAGE